MPNGRHALRPRLPIAPMSDGPGAPQDDRKLSLEERLARLGPNQRALLEARLRGEPITGHRLVARTLRGLGITHVYGVPGQPVYDTFAACAAAGLRLIGTRHQQPAALMAAAHNYFAGRQKAATIVQHRSARGERGWRGRDRARQLLAARRSGRQRADRGHGLLHGARQHRALSAHCQMGDVRHGDPRNSRVRRPCVRSGDARAGRARCSSSCPRMSSPDLRGAATMPPCLPLLPRSSPIPRPWHKPWPCCITRAALC